MVYFYFELTNPDITGYIIIEIGEDILEKFRIEYGTNFILKQLVLKEDCAGCRFAYANQLGHMDCPDGCLHDKNICESCIKK